METILITIVFLVPFFILWLLYDTISEFLYSGKPAMTKELKSF